ncbi:MAG: hypothetical protein IJU48_07450 [Synergistaceae bacterium]|nr:hypothetical protein [Synergistaceae bacterium]
MAYQENSLTTVGHLKKIAGKNKDEADALTLAQAVLSARMDAQVMASTDGDADYASEVVDGRIDTWGNIQGSLGVNVRSGQNRLQEALNVAQILLQAEIEAVSEARLENTLNIAEANETRRRELAKEEEDRTSDDNSLQEQINSLSEAVLGILTIISENRERQKGG